MALGINIEKEIELVEAIENGRIVRVREDYARREGLMILRRANIEQNKEKASGGSETSLRKKGSDENYVRNVYGVDEFRKPLHIYGNKVIQELVPNFQWEISRARRAKNVTRKQLADAIGEQERAVKMIENGILIKDDFVLINRIQEHLKINLRKDGADYYNNMLKKAMDSSNLKPKESNAESYDKEIDFEEFEEK